LLIFDKLQSHTKSYKEDAYEREREKLQSHTKKYKEDTNVRERE
jgi:hypothetical protein